MNCIAYGENNGKNNGNSEDDIEEEEDDDHAFSKSHSPSSDFRSLSTDTTSEITDVTTRPSSSGCSSMSKHESADNIKALEENKPLKSPEKSEQKQDTQEAASIGTSMKLIVDALDSFERKERRSGTSSASSTIQKNGVRRKNMSFTNEECRKIKRENEILIKKLEGLSKLRPKQTVAVNQPRLSSSAINRRKQQAQIERDNMMHDCFTLPMKFHYHSLQGIGDGCNDDAACLALASQDRIGLEAIKSLHRQLDDDANGNVDLSESDEFLREELKYEEGYERRQKAFHRNDDKHISVRELWEAWIRSEPLKEVSDTLEAIRIVNISMKLGGAGAVKLELK
ncbi:hypothetical protein ANN_02573 [Periplaneta americana]|uniref:STIM1/2 EF-hand domain-containing protein n=1 Tax=Periplaneta americana TaxID=6978 RepID=A0ABQ8TXV4_PERAM|nr:hypothetical protein ANN_02573 [Periplaneta americana]